MSVFRCKLLGIICFMGQILKNMLANVFLEVQWNAPYLASAF